eukprot:TRINITY_DN1044_c0_g1_i2.p1 TRINITY_DN1044_c0_g1~~TRINITY_DN1044_c0_g1_i2.p1  ORF type:complete len:268 (-),score=49.61 TRINITY_DN1044_c0_g1_i2:622-1425(-)
MTEINNLTPGKVTICVVNYKTEELTRLCLRSIRKFTDFPYEVIVVDNDSGDSSLEYLRSLSWIKLIERPGEMKDSGSWAHGTALDKGLEACSTEFFMPMHSDTFVHKKGWLKDMVAYCHKDVACVGGGKLDLKPRWELLLKRCTDVKKLIRKLKNKGKRDDFYVRTICALFRTDVLFSENLRFAMNVDKYTCGKSLYYELLDRGYKSKVLDPFKMAEYIDHLAHATMVLNPEFKVRDRTDKKCRQHIQKVFDSSLVKEIMADNSLDN